MSSVQFAAPPLTPFVKRLIITLGSAFIVELILENFARIAVVSNLALWPSALGLHTAWQILSYVLVEPPAQVGGVMIGLLFLWLIMSPFELRFGARRTLELSLFAVLCASLANVLVGLVVADSPPLFGSNPITYAGMAAMARAYGSGRVSLFGAFQMTPNQLLGLLAGLAFVWFLATRDHTQLIASLASLAAGVGYVEWMKRGMSLFGAGRGRSKRGGFRVVQGGRDDDRPKWMN